MLITKAVCDQERCKKEFSLDNGGYTICVLPSKEVKLGPPSILTIGIKKTEADDCENDNHVCGKECLHKWIDQQLENLNIKEVKSGTIPKDSIGE
jgi:hypothetical protein